MKNKNYIKAVFLCLLTMTLFSSCLKDDRYVDFPGAGPLVDLPAVAFNGIFNELSFAASATPTPYPVLVNISAPNALKTPVNVVLKVDPAALDAYNAKQKTSYTLLPATAFTVSNYTVTVPANETKGTLTVNFITSAIKPTDNFVLPITIVSSDAGTTTISQYKTILYHVTLK